MQVLAAGHVWVGVASPRPPTSDLRLRSLVWPAPDAELTVRGPVSRDPVEGALKGPCVVADHDLRHLHDAVEAGGGEDAGQCVAAAAPWLRPHLVRIDTAITAKVPLGRIGAGNPVNHV